MTHFNDEKVKRRNTYFTLLNVTLFCLIIIVLFATLYKEIGCDEIEAIHSAWKVANGEMLYVDFFQNHNPLFYYILYPILILTGRHIATIYIIRFLVFLIVILTDYLIYRIGKLKFDTEVGLIAAILFFPAMFVFNGAEIRPDVPMVLFELLGLYLLFLFFAKNKLSYLVFSAISLATSFLFLQKAVVFIVSIYVLLCYKYIRKKISLRNIFIYTFVLFGTLLPCYLYLGITHGLSSYYYCCFTINRKWVMSKHYNFNFLLHFLYLLGVQYYLVIFFILGIFFFSKDEDKKFLVFSAITLLAFVGISKYQWAQYYLPAIPFLALIGAGCFQGMTRGDRAKLLLLALLIIYPVFLMLHSVSKPDSMRKRSIERIRYVMENTDPNDIVYDPFLLINVFFKNDVGYYWMINGGLKTNYLSDAYRYIKQLKPRVFTPYDTSININHPLIRRFYQQSCKFKELYFIKPSYLIDLITIKYWLNTHKNETISFIDTINPSSLDFETIKKVGEQFYQNRDNIRAIYWLKNAVNQNPIAKECLKMIVTALKEENKTIELKKYKSKLVSLKKVVRGPYVFEKGNSLEGFLIKNEKNSDLRIKIYLDILDTRDINTDHTAFISFEKNGNFYFGKDFSLFNAKPLGKLRYINGAIQIPQNIPPGTYNIFFTFRIPKIDYRYHLIEENKILCAKKVHVGKISIIDK